MCSVVSLVGLNLVLIELSWPTLCLLKDIFHIFFMLSCVPNLVYFERSKKSTALPGRRQDCSSDGDRTVHRINLLSGPVSACSSLILSLIGQVAIFTYVPQFTIP